MRVFMLGWEFPPFISGGLGTACYGLANAMSTIGADILFVLPRPVTTPFSTHLRLVSPRPGSPLEMPSTEFRLDEFDHVTFRTVNANLTPYQSVGESKQLADTQTGRRAVQVESSEPEVKPSAGKTTVAPAAAGTNYAGDLLTEVQRYAALAAEVARGETFDVVHAHDWMTFPAGLAVAGLKGVQLVVQVHSTEFD